MQVPQGVRQLQHDTSNLSFMPFNFVVQISECFRQKTTSLGWFSASAFVRGQVVVANVGDSRALLIRDGKAKTSGALKVGPWEA